MILVYYDKSRSKSPWDTFIISYPTWLYPSVRSSPESADTSEFPVECGDVILVATDGVFDNVPEPVLLAELRRARDLAGDAPRLQVRVILA